MTIFLSIIAVLLLIVGIIGAIVPALPGPPLSWVALLIIYFAIPGGVSLSVLLLMLLLTVVVTLLDYVAPAITTKWGGGSKAAVWGATLGVSISKRRTSINPLRWLYGRSWLSSFLPDSNWWPACGFHGIAWCQYGMRLCNKWGCNSSFKARIGQIVF